MDTELSKRIHHAALSCGFDDCGIIPIDALDGFDSLLQERKQNVPASSNFYNFMEKPWQPRQRFPWAKSIIICSFWHGKYRYPVQLQGHYAKDFFLQPEADSENGYDCLHFESWLHEQGIRFAGGKQYGNGSIAPLRYAAVMAGMGIFRKNNFFYTEKGSYNHLIGYVIDQKCELIHHSNLIPCSDSCNLCSKACKTKALSSPYTLDPLKCVSFCTTFGKGTIPQDLDPDMFEEWICGCDNCQDACPYNQKHNWNAGESCSVLEIIAEELLPENILKHSENYLINHVISKTADHLQPSDTYVLQKNARRALQYRNKDRHRK